MVAAMFQQGLETEYEIARRELVVAYAGRERSSKDRFHTQARYDRGARRQGPANSAHRRSTKVA